MSQLLGHPLFRCIIFFLTLLPYSDENKHSQNTLKNKVNKVIGVILGIWLLRSGNENKVLKIS